MNEYDLTPEEQNKLFEEAFKLFPYSVESRKGYVQGVLAERARTGREYAVQYRPRGRKRWLRIDEDEISDKLAGAVEIEVFLESDMNYYESRVMSRPRPGGWAEVPEEAMRKLRKKFRKEKEAEDARNA